jgi:hypothetical protein
VNGFVGTGKLTPAQGQTLVQAAQAIVNQLPV